LRTIINYFDLVDKIGLLRKSNDELMKAFNKADEEWKNVLGDNEHIDFQEIF